LSYAYNLQDTKESTELTLFSDIQEVMGANLLKGRKKEEILDFLSSMRNKIKDFVNISIEKTMYEILGHLEIIKKEDTGENLKILYDLGKLSEIIVNFSNYYRNSNIEVLNELPEKINLNKKTEEVEVVDNSSLYLMNIHQAKGLQFPVVIIPSLISKRFPNTRRSQTLLNLPKEFFLYEPYEPLKEEENLFYVAITRAKDLLVLSSFNKYDSDRKASASDFLNSVLPETKEDELDVKLIDYSAISTFIDCPERFKLNYLYGFRAEQIFQQKVGTIYHNAIAKVNQKLIDKEKIVTDTLNKIIEDSWIDLGPSKNDVFRKKIFNGINNYVKFMLADFKKAISIEKPVSIIKEKLRIRGRTDFIYKNKKGEIVLLDYKSRKIESIDETHVDYQLKFYNDALKKEGLKIDKAIAYPIEEENIDKKINKCVINIKSNKEITELLEKFNKCILDKKYSGTKKGSQFCKECPYKPLCKYNKIEKKK
jgi:DNA helicase-2/ATP-dependent DNA helicase PcrA